MEKYLLTIELRYTDFKNGDTRLGNNTTTIGVYDEAQEAYNAGNKVCELLESKYKLHKFPDGRDAVKERFSKNGGPFGQPNHLITNSAYLKTPFEFYLKITRLKYNDLEEVLTEAEAGVKRYRDFKIRNED